jgi:aspartyl-tRNA(Asn)/glutamyl-tRNA(Gln) amidotransferase subunit B
MRVKETADDYRMYPDPDLAPFDLSDEFVQSCRSRVPELPDDKRDRYMADYGLKRKAASQIAGDPETARFFEEAVRLAPGVVQTVANVVVNVVPTTPNVMPVQVARIAELLSADDITFAQAREVLAIVEGTDADPRTVVDERGMRQSNDADALVATVDEVLARCVEQVRQYRDGNKKVVGFLVGQCMKASHGTGNPKLFNQLLRQRLDG